MENHEDKGLCQELSGSRRGRIIGLSKGKSRNTIGEDDLFAFNYKISIKLRNEII